MAAISRYNSTQPGNTTSSGAYPQWAKTALMGFKGPTTTTLMQRPFLSSFIK
jgi:hypothetical protein